MKITLLTTFVAFLLPLGLAADDLADYFSAETRLLSSNALSGIKTAADWEAKKEGYRKQLFEMLSLDPLPPKSDLKPVVTGRAERDDFIVENLHFQSMPGLYVTANFYLPKNHTGNLPTILYVCGHGPVITNGVSYGNKVAYQHHGAWFARNGYACLTIDTIQLGEIQGLHHGTHRENMWWWNSRGYSSAGAEAWNCIRALDYLESRPEVDKNRLGVTGRSGGGAYSWWVAALDERIKVAAPVAGITDLHNHIVDGVVEGHCDCMFFVNTHRWDYTILPALVAPRPLLIANSDKDTIFPLDGVYRTHQHVARIYKLLNASTNLGLLITEGPHKDTQDLQVPVFRWFNRYFKKDLSPVELVAKPFFTPQELKVFPEIPTDQVNTRLHEQFVPMARAKTPQSQSEWASMQKSWMQQLRTKVFAGWPEPGRLHLPELTTLPSTGGQLLSIGILTSQPTVPVPVFLIQPEPSRGDSVALILPNEQEWPALAEWLNTRFDLKLVGATNKPLSNSLRQALEQQNSALAIVVPRGIMHGSMPEDARKRTHVRRRYMLLGQTLDSMRVYDIRHAVQFLQEHPATKGKKLSGQASGFMAVNLLYASLFEPGLTSLRLDQLPRTHMEGPDYLNVLRFLDIPQALAMAAAEKKIVLTGTGEQVTEFPLATAKLLGRPENLKLNSN